MLLPFSGFVCLWLCSEAAETQTKTSSSAQSRGWRPVPGEDKGRSPWTEPVNPSPSDLLRAVRKSDAPNGDGALRTGVTKAVTGGGRPGEKLKQTQRGHTCGLWRSFLQRRRRRRSEMQDGDGDGDGDGALRTGVTKAVTGGGHPGEKLKQTQRGHTCGPWRSFLQRRRRRRSEPPQDGDGDGDGEQDPRPPFGLNNASDYEEEEEDSIPDPTPPNAPVNPRTRRRPLKNPFYPLTAEALGAYAVSITAALVFGLGVLGNVSVMCIVCHNYYMRSISNALLANLALWDFVVIFFCLPLVVFRELTKDWLLGEFSCRIIPYLEVASLGVTTFTLCALCIDRFRAATNVQLYYEMIENWASTAAKLAVIWVGALLLALPELLIRQLVTEDGDPPDATPCERCVIRISTDLPDTLYVLGLTYDGARLWWYFGCYFCLPTLFTICCSLVTARKIRHAERACVRGGKKQIQMESQMNCAVVALAILYGFCIIPENICNIVGAYMAASVPRRTLDILQLVSQMLLFCKSAVTPVLLFCLCQPFTRAFMDCCCCCCVECGPPRRRNADATPTAATGSDTDNEFATTELELSPFSTIRREPSTSYAVVGTHC